MSFLLEGKNKTHKVYQKLIDQHKTTLNEQAKVLDLNQNVEYTNFIDAFLLEREKRKSDDTDVTKFYSDDQFYHLLADIFGAGLDTTLATLRWFFLFMVAYPDEQSKVQEELDQILEDKMPNLEDMANLPLLEAAICEVQRIRSVVPVGIPHGTLEDTEIEGRLHEVFRVTNIGLLNKKLSMEVTFDCLYEPQSWKKTREVMAMRHS